MTRALAMLGAALALDACRCAQPGDDVLYACEPDGGCEAAHRCFADQLCHPLDGGSAGGTAGGGHAGGSAGGGHAGGTAGGATAGGGAAGGTAGGDDGGVDSGCTVGDVPDDNGIDSNCDGVDGVAQTGVFVDPVNGTPGGLGFIDQPVQSLTRALQLAAINGRTDIFISTGVLAEDGVALRADSGFSLHGGYTRSDGGWPREAHAGCGDGGLPVLIGGPTALLIQGATQQLTVEYLCVQSLSADAGASIGLSVAGGVAPRLRFLDITAGDGVDGLPGSNGDAGADGAPGEDGADSIIAGPANPGGRGGRGPCGLPAFDGGAGAVGSLFNSGQPGGGPLGGVAGTYVLDQCFNTCSSCAMQTSSGGDGGHGDAGRPGLDGGAGDALGAVSAQGAWAPHHGQNGTPGLFGTPGSGGGGTGMYRVTAGGYASGASGGGGGAPGCGGAAGLGGQSGGASIGLLVVGVRPLVEGTLTVRASRGGSGAVGGQGGPGGDGGLGGAAGHGLDTWCSGSGVLNDAGMGVFLTGPHGSNGGNGGNGGPGGSGGNGGPGAGGSSFGIWCTADGGLVRGASPLGTLNPFAGTPGDGGAAGLGGLSAATFNCVVQ